MRGAYIAVCVIVSIFFTACGIKITIDAIVNYISCKVMTKDIGMNHRWRIFGGCQVQVEQGWIPLDYYKYVNKK